MKTKSKFLLLASSLFLTSCVQFGGGEPITYTKYTPIMMVRSSLEKSITMKPAKPIEKAAKIYYKDSYIYISERFKGVHIIDNSNPSNPIKKAFIDIPGCIDMAIKKNVLYVDNAVDLVAIDLTEAEGGTLQVLKRIENVMPEVMPPDGGAIPDKYRPHNRPKDAIIVDWKLNGK